MSFRPLTVGRHRDLSRWQTIIRAIGKSWTTLICAAPAVLLVAVCCGAPLLWVLSSIVSHPSVVADLGLNRFRAALLARTLAYNVLVAIVATLVALCPALVIGRGRGKSATFLLVTLPAVLFMPFLALEYGWLQCVRMLRPVIQALGWSLEPGGWLDVARCIWSLSSWLWVVPAFIIGMSLRQIDPAIQESALLDGDTFRITLRQLSGPIVASLAVVTILATQEYAVYEPTGINVVATEVRMVFSTGAFSSLPDRSYGRETTPLTQSERAAASVATAAPLLFVTLLLVGFAMRLARRLSVAETLHVGTWSPRLDAPNWILALALLVLIICIGAPLLALLGSIQTTPTNEQLLQQLTTPMLGSLTMFAITFMAATLIALSAAAAWPRWLFVIAVLAFFVGGELLAIALINLCNRPSLELVRESFILPVAAYLGRFGWIALAISRCTWTRAWNELRTIAALEGAGPLRAAVYVVWPLAWPMLIVAGLLIGVLSMTEVAATGTLSPQHPPVLTNTLLIWVHKNHFEPMIEASLMFTALLIMLGLSVSAFVACVVRRYREIESQNVQ